MKVFYENVLSLIPKSRFRSREELSAYVFDGKGKYLANAQKKNQEPSLRRAKMIADALGVSLDDLVRDAHDAPEPGDQLVAILQAVTQSRSIKDLGGLIEHVDLYHTVQRTDLSLKPYRMGALSLSSQILQRSDVPNMRRGLRSLPPEIDAKLAASYEAAAAGLPVISVETINAQIAVAPYHVSLKYVRLLLLVLGPGQTRLVLNYSYALPQQ